MKTVNVLGTEYEILNQTKEENPILERADGYCDKTTRKICVLKIGKDDCDLGEPSWYEKKVLRHEIIHAFLFESGLHECGEYEASSSCHPEQMVDWIAIQFPKILKAFLEVGAIECDGFVQIPTVPKFANGGIVDKNLCLPHDEGKEMVTEEITYINSSEKEIRHLSVADTVKDLAKNTEAGA